MIAIARLRHHRTPVTDPSGPSEVLRASALG